MLKISKIIRNISLLVISMLILGGCTANQSYEVYEYSYFAFDTPISVNIYYDNDEIIEFEKIKSDLNLLLTQLDNEFDNYTQGTVISQLNETKSATVSDDFLNVALKTQEYALLSDGLIDPTLAPVIDLWSINNENNIPTTDEITNELKKVNYENVVINGNTITLKNDATIDYGAVVKGYAADQIETYLLDQGVTSALINLGGNVQVLGSKPDMESFKIGIMAPEIDNITSENAAVLTVEDTSVVTSGINQRYFEYEDKLYHHIIDPTTGFPVDSNLASVTVLTDTGIDGDLLSTYLFILGVDEGMKVVNQNANIEAVFITKDKNIYPSSEEIKIEVVDPEYKLNSKFYESK